jgi:hypothetical protein
MWMQMQLILKTRVAVQQAFVHGLGMLGLTDNAVSFLVAEPTQATLPR